MQTKTLIAGLASGIVTFLLGWLVFGILLMDYYNAHSFHYTGIMKNPPVIWAIGLGNLSWGIMIAYILSLSGIKSAAKGFTTGFIVFLLAIAGFDLLFYGTVNLYGLRITSIDILLNALMGGVSGAVAALVLGRK